MGLHVIKELGIVVSATVAFPEHLSAYIAMLEISPDFRSALGDNMVSQDRTAGGILKISDIQLLRC